MIRSLTPTFLCAARRGIPLTLSCMLTLHVVFCCCIIRQQSDDVDSFNWPMLLLLCISAPLVLSCDWFDRGSRQVKRELVDLATEDYDASLCQGIDSPNVNLDEDCSFWQTLPIAKPFYAQVL